MRPAFILLLATCAVHTVCGAESIPLSPDTPFSIVCTSENMCRIVVQDSCLPIEHPLATHQSELIAGVLALDIAAAYREGAEQRMFDVLVVNARIANAAGAQAKELAARARMYATEGVNLLAQANGYAQFAHRVAKTCDQFPELDMLVQQFLHDPSQPTATAAAPQ